MNSKLKNHLLSVKAEIDNADINITNARKQNQTIITDTNGKPVSSLLFVNSLPNGKIQTVNSMKYHSRKIKETLNLLEKNADTKRPYGIKRAATVLLTENKLAYVDYDRCDYVTNRFLVKFTEI
jgi:hypothetical protein